MIFIQPINSKNHRYVYPFLRNIVINKALNFTAHLGSYIDRYHELGINFFSQAQRRFKSRSPEWEEYKVKSGYSSENLVFTGQTRAQAEFSSLTAEVHMTGRGNILQNIHSIERKDSRSPWHDKKTTPFYYFNKSWEFFRPGEYYGRSRVLHDASIWKTNISGDISIQDATKNLVIPNPKCQAILKRSIVDLGSVSNNKKKGLLSRWH